MSLGPCTGGANTLLQQMSTKPNQASCHGHTAFRIVLAFDTRHSVEAIILPATHLGGTQGEEGGITLVSLGHPAIPSALESKDNSCSALLALHY